MFLVGLLILVGAIALFFHQAQQRQYQRSFVDFPYQKRLFFFTRAEQRFYEHLARSIGLVSRDLTIFSKVRLADLVMMTKGTTGRAYWSAWARISQKHADFVILGPLKRPGEPDALQPLAVIELDDSSHQREDRIHRDQLVDAIYGRAGIPILHIPVMASYDVQALARQIRTALRLPEAVEAKPKVVVPVSER